MFAGNHADRIRGGDGTDTINGGPGADVIEWQAGDGGASVVTSDIISGFNLAEDRLWFGRAISRSTPSAGSSSQTCCSRSIPARMPCSTPTPRTKGGRSSPR
jgi:hypothetical protein